MKDSTSAGKVAKMISSIADLVGQIFPIITAAMRDSIGVFTEMVDVCVAIVPMFDLIAGKMKNWMEKVGAICFCAAGILTVIKFLDRVKHTAVAQALGTFPFINFGMGLCAGIGYSFAIANDSYNLHVRDIEHDIRLGKKACWEAMNDAIIKLQTASNIGLPELKAAQVALIKGEGAEKTFREKFTYNLRDVWNAEDKKPFAHSSMYSVEEKTANQWAAFINKTAAAVETGPGPEPVTYEEKAKRWDVLKHKVTFESKDRYPALVSQFEGTNLKIENTKNILGIIAAVSKIAVITLSMLAVFGVIVLSATSPLMLSFAVAAALIAVVKVVFDKTHEFDVPKEGHLLTDYRKVAYQKELNDWNKARKENERHNSKNNPGERPPHPGAKPTNLVSFLEAFVNTPYSKVKITAPADVGNSEGGSEAHSSGEEAEK